VVHPGLTRRLGDASGQSSIEFAAGIWVLLAAAVIAWQLALVGWTANVEANAARTAARAYSRTSDKSEATKAGMNGMSSDGFNPKSVTIVFTGDEARVSVQMPLIVPWLHVPLTLPPARATMPSTG
jgi:Flp pilus assembly protein TadG